MQVLLLLILKVHLKSGTFNFLLKDGCHCVTSTFTKVNIIWLFLLLLKYWDSVLPPPLVVDNILVKQTVCFTSKYEDA